MSKILPGMVLLGFSALAALAWRAHRAQQGRIAQAQRDLNRWEDEGGQSGARRQPLTAESNSYLV